MYGTTDPTLQSSQSFLFKTTPRAYRGERTMPGPPRLPDSPPPPPAPWVATGASNWNSALAPPSMVQSEQQLRPSQQQVVRVKPPPPPPLERSAASNITYSGSPAPAAASMAAPPQQQQQQQPQVVPQPAPPTRTKAPPAAALRPPPSQVTAQPPPDALLAAVPAILIDAAAGYMVAWQVQGDTANSWTDFELAFAERLETAWRGAREPFDAKPGNRHTYRYDVGRSLQVNLTYGSERVLRRIFIVSTEWAAAQRNRTAAGTRNAEQWATWEARQPRPAASAPAARQRSQQPRPSWSGHQASRSGGY